MIRLNGSVTPARARRSIPSADDGRDVLQDACAHRRRADRRAATASATASTSPECSARTGPTVTSSRSLVGDQADGVAAAPVERVEQRLVHVHEGDAVARFAEELAR